MSLNRRDFFKTGLAAALLVANPGPIGFAQVPFSKRFLLSVDGCGRATGYAEANKIVTRDGKTHVAWLDSVEEGFRVRVRTLDHASGDWSPPVTVGEGYDNHGGPALTMDAEGYLHIAYYPHHHPMRYRRSVKPNDASEWTEVEEFGARTTYPTLVCGKEGTLYCACRESGDGPWHSNLYVKKPGGTWEGPRSIMVSQQGGYSHFMEALAWGPDQQTLHLSTRIYSGKPGRGHTVGYMRSHDGGETWENSRGEAIALPATADTIDVVASAGEDEGAGLRAGSIAVDGNNVPCILYSDYDGKPTEAWLARPDGEGGWEKRPLLPHLPEKLAGYGLLTPGVVSIGQDGLFHIALTAVDRRDDPEASLWGHLTNEVVWMELASFDGEIASRVVSEVDRETPAWLPNVERPTGHNVVDEPGLIYTVGERGEKNTDILSNDVMWVRP